VTASFLSTVEKHSRIGSIFSKLLTLSPFRLVRAEGSEALFCEGRFLAGLLRKSCAGTLFRISVHSYIPIPQNLSRAKRSSAATSISQVSFPASLGYGAKLGTESGIDMLERLDGYFWVE